MSGIFDTARWVVFAGLIGVVVVSVLPARVHNQDWNFTGSSLTVSTPYAKSVSILPGGAPGHVVVAARGHAGEIDALKLTGGDTVQIAGSGCHAGLFTNPTLALTITVPTGMAVTVNESAATEYNIAAVNGPLVLQLDGSGDVQAAAATNVTVNSTGRGDAKLGSVTGAVQATLQGSGDLDIGTIAAPTTNLVLSGSGDANIGNGNAGAVAATLSDDGDLHAPAVAGLKLTMSGNGDATAAQDNGPLTAAMSGNGDLKLDGVSGDAVVNDSGAGDVDILHVAGHVSQTNTGSGDIKIGGM